MNKKRSVMLLREYWKVKIYTLTHPGSTVLSFKYSYYQSSLAPSSNECSVQHI